MLYIHRFSLSLPSTPKVSIYHNINGICIIPLLVNILATVILSLNKRVSQFLNCHAAPVLDKRYAPKKLNSLFDVPLFNFFEYFFIAVLFYNGKCAFRLTYDGRSSWGAIDNWKLSKAIAKSKANYFYEPILLLKKL